MARVFTAYVITRDPVTGQKLEFKPGDAVPESLTNVGDHAATSEGTTTEVQTIDDAPANVVVTDADGSTTEIEADADEDADETEDEEALPPYEEWSKEDLKAEAKGRQLTGYSKLSVDELVELLQADDAENPED